MRNNLTLKILAAALIVYLVACILTAATTFLCKSVFSPSAMERATYGDIRSRNQDRIEIEVREFQSGDFYGTVRVVLVSPEALASFKEAEDTFVVIQGVHMANFMLQLPRLIKLKVTEKNATEITLASSSKERLYSRGTSFSYPLDSYYLEMSAQLNFYNAGSNKPKVIDPGYFTALLDLDKAFAVTKLEKIPDINCNSRECPDYLDDVYEDEFLFFIERQPWVKATIFALMGLMLVPLLIMVSVPTSSMNIDLLAVLISSVTLRTFLLGSTAQVHAIDFAFGSAILAVAIVALTRLVLVNKN